MPKIDKIYRKTILACFDEINLIGFDEDKKVTDLVSLDTRHRVDEKINEWRDEGLLTGYLLFLTQHMRYTYAYIIKVMALGCYYETVDEIEQLCNGVFENIGHDVVRQLNDETNGNYYYDWETIFDLLIVPVVGLSFHDYLLTLAQVNAEELEKQMIIALQHDVSLRKLLSYAKKQTNRLICVNGDRYSGALNETSRALFNSYYVKLLSGQNVTFIAEMDDRTTPMCRSLDGQVFSVDKLNKFDRYSALADGIMHYEVVGLITGLNLPPINDHFHWCRSTIMVNISA